MRHGSRRTFLTVEECDCIQIRELAAAGVFATENAPFGALSWPDGAGASQTYRVVRVREKTCLLLVPLGESPGTQAQSIEITRSSCNYGSFRYWFHCPGLFGQPCRRRVTALFRPPDVLLFACRTCHRLTYRSAQTHDARVDRIAQDPCLMLDLLQSGNLRHRLLAVAAANKLRERLRQRR